LLAGGDGGRSIRARRLRKQRLELKLDIRSGSDDVELECGDQLVV
jgi:hypothetical protein